MKRILRIAGIILLSFATIAVALVIAFLIGIKVSEEKVDVPDPFLTESEEEIRESILRLTPIGSDAEDVLVIMNENEEKFFFGRAPGDPLAEFDPVQSPSVYSGGYWIHGENVIFGEKSIRIELGTYKDRGQLFYTGV